MGVTPTTTQRIKKRRKKAAPTGGSVRKSPLQCAPSRASRAHTSCLLPTEMHLLKTHTPRKLRQAVPGAFRPRMPSAWYKSPTAWLTNQNIDAVLTQYHAAHPHFAFLGTYPVDFMTAPGPSLNECLFKDVCRLNIATDLPRGTQSFALVINTDTHDGKGEHWIACYVTLVGRVIYFFDSYGRPPPKPLMAFFQKLQKQMGPGGVTVRFNKRRIQAKNSECGVFCIMFIVRMLLDDSPTAAGATSHNTELFDLVCDSMEHDDAINAYRDLLWSRV